MVARDVYEAGFENLRRHLRPARRRARRRRAAAPLPRGAPLPSRAGPAARATAAPEQLELGDGEAPPPRARRSAHPPARDRRQLLRHLPAPRLDPGAAAGFGRCPACRAWRRPARSSMSATASARVLPGDRVAYLGPLPGAYCSVRTVPADWVVRLPAAVEDETAAALLLKGLTADYLLRDLGRVARRHAAAGACGGGRRRPARLRLGATPRRDRDRHGVERGEGAGRARARLRARDRHARLPLRRRGAARRSAAPTSSSTASAMRRATRTSPRWRARGHWISLGQASGALQPISPDWLVQKSATFSRPVVFDYVATPAQLAERAQRVWDALADGPLRAADRALCARCRGAGPRAARIARDDRRARPVA